MKKKRINLLGSRFEYLQIEKQFYYVRLLTVVLFFAFLFIFLLTNLRLLEDKKQLDQTFAQKKVLLENQQENVKEEAKIKLLFNKHQDIQNFLKEDSHFLPYYQLLIASLKIATPEPALLSFKVDNQKNTEFILGFSNFDQMIKFLSFIENEDFLNKFETLVLNGFSLDTSKMELLFKGKFISLKNETF